MLATVVMAGESMTQKGFEWGLGAIGFIALASIAIGFYIQIKSIRKKAQDEMDAKLAKEGKAIRREVETEAALRAMKESIDKLTESVSCLRVDVSGRQEKIERQVALNTKIIVRLDQSLKAAHNRMDEHRALEHGLPSRKNHSGSLPIEQEE